MRVPRLTHAFSVCICVLELHVFLCVCVFSRVACFVASFFFRISFIYFLELHVSVFLRSLLCEFRAALVITICLSYFGVCQIGGILLCYALCKCVYLIMFFLEVVRVRNLGIFFFPGFSCWVYAFLLCVYTIILVSSFVL